VDRFGYAAVMSLPWIVLSGLLAFAMQAAAPAGDAPLSSYRDPALKMTYQYPSDLKPQQQMADALTRGFASGAADDGDAKVAKCITVPVAVTKATGAPGEGEFGLIVILRVDQTCIGEPGTKENLGAAAQLLTRILKPFGLPITEDALSYQLDGHDAAFVKGSAQAKMLGEGKMLHAASVCALVDTNTLCWLIVNSNHKAMPNLVANPVTFDGRSAVPLVPKELVTAW
jgi:hypothetical protein